MDKLAAGFSTAEIRLWGINNTVLVKPKCGETYIPIACDISPFYEYNEEGSTV